MGKIVPILIVVAIVGITLALMVSIVPYGTAAVVTHMGVIDENEKVRLAPFLRTPFVDGVELRSIQTQKYPNVASDADLPIIESTSKDQQTIKTQYVVIYSLNPDTLPSLVKNVVSYEVTLLSPHSNSAVKGVMGKFDAFQMVKERAKVEAAIADDLRERLANAEKCKGCINVESVQLINLGFDEQYEQAIKQKNVAIQKLDEAKINLETEAVRSDTKRVAAQGDADAIRIVNEAIEASPNALANKALDKWNGQVPLVQGQENGVVPMIQLPSK